MDIQSESRVLSGLVIVDATVEKVWQAWATDEGVRSFLAPDSRIDARPNGPYEVYFDPSQPSGLRGSEGMRVLAVQPPHMLSFTWNAPPSLPSVRDQLTHVVVRLADAGADRAVVTLTHDGWDEEWDQAYAYFQRAWFDIVLRRLQHRFDNGPIDWDDPPGH